MLLLCRIADWPMAEYWRPDHPVQRLYAATVARVFDTMPEMLVTSVDACGVPTYAFPLYEVARAFALLAEPALIPESDSSGAPAERGAGAGLAIGSLVRVIRAPHFGRVGQVVELPPELRRLETEAMVRVLVVVFPEDGARVLVPRANVEIIAT